jgi:hypothetical protein
MVENPVAMGVGIGEANRVAHREGGWGRLAGR